MTQRERLGKYEIIEVLGKGAMGVVYKGFDPGIDRTVAIKTVRKELIEDDDRAGMALARFRNEARAAAAGAAGARRCRCRGGADRVRAQVAHDSRCRIRCPGRRGDRRLVGSEGHVAGPKPRAHRGCESSV
jgi:serine/threonine protein kinase